MSNNDVIGVDLPCMTEGCDGVVTYWLDIQDGSDPCPVCGTEFPESYRFMFEIGGMPLFAGYVLVDDK